MNLRKLLTELENERFRVSEIPIEVEADAIEVLFMDEEEGETFDLDLVEFDVEDGVFYIKGERA